jgi:hypothetical protein
MAQTHTDASQHAALMAQTHTAASLHAALLCGPLVGPDAFTQLPAAAVSPLVQPRITIDRRLLAMVFANMRGSADGFECWQEAIDTHENNKRTPYREGLQQVV